MEASFLLSQNGVWQFWGSTKKTTTDFEVKLGETIATSFEAKLEKTVAIGFEAKLEKTVIAGFEAKPLETVATAGFEAKLPETVATGFEAKPAKTIRVVLRPNHSQTIAIGFKAQTDEKQSEWFWGQTTHKLSTLVLRLNQDTHAPRLHVHGADRTQCYPTSRSLGHWVPDLCNHPRSSALGLLLLPWSSSLHVMPHLPPAHHETSKRDSPNETKVKEKQNKIIPNSNSNLAKSMTHHNQTKELTTWFLTIQETFKFTRFGLVLLIVLQPLHSIDGMVCFSLLVMALGWARLVLVVWLLLLLSGIEGRLLDQGIIVGDSQHLFWCPGVLHDELADQGWVLKSFLEEHNNW
jgi:hypothetical protein